MCNKVKGRVRLIVSYLSILIIGILIYLVVLFAIDKHHKKNNIDEFIADESADDLGLGEMSANLMNPSAIVGESIDNTLNNNSGLNLDITDRHSLNELPSEIDSAIDSIEMSSVASDSASDLPNDSANEFPKQFVVNTQILRIRNEPNTDSAVIKHFKSGAIISVNRIENKWAQLENGGWAYLPLLKEHKQLNP